MEVTLYKAKHTYSPENTDELSFKKGDILRLIKKVDGAWWEGEVTNKNGKTQQRGWFPSNYVRELKQTELDKLRKDKIFEKTEKEVPRASRVLNDQKYRQVVLEEIVSNTTRFLQEVDHVIGVIYPEIKPDHQTYFNFKKLVQSLVLISSVEKAIIGQIQAAADQVKLGVILLEKMAQIREAFESYYSIHPATVESLRRDGDTLKSLDSIRTYLAKPLLRLENVPLKLRDLEKYYGETDEDRLELGRAIYQIEQTLARCLEIRRGKELELTLLQQPILNWSGEPIDRLGTMRLMVQVNIRAGREQRTTQGYGLVFSSSVILITATDRMSGFVLITNLPTANASACRHNEKTVELTGASGHFWLDFSTESDAQEWWGAMQSLGVAKTRSSFTPYVSQGERMVSRAETESSISLSGASVSKHAPVKLLPSSSSTRTTVHSTTGSPPPIKPSQSSSTLLSTASSSFCPRPTPPCHGAPVLTSPRASSSSRTRDGKRRPRSRPRQATPDNDLAKSRQRNDTEILTLLRAYNGNAKEAQRPESQPTQEPAAQLTAEQLDELLQPILTPLRDEVADLRSKMATMENAMHTEKMKLKNMRTKLEDETKARKQLETHIVKWQQDHDENQTILKD